MFFISHLLYYSRNSCRNLRPVCPGWSCTRMKKPLWNRAYLKIRAKYIRNHEKRQHGRTIRFTASHVGRLISIYDECIYCGSKDNLVIEHIVPLSKGGETKFDNLALACYKCNDRKMDISLNEWDGAKKPIERRYVKGQKKLGDFEK
jgi:5-methylcytosine-specific restriction endonuclease McrA